MNGYRTIEGMIAAHLKRPDDFGHHGDWRDRTETGRWTFGPTLRHRDSDLIDRCNAEVIIEELGERFPEWDGEAGDWSIENVNHWAVGWVDHLCYRALDENGEPTPVAHYVFDVLERLDNYPILDEDRHSSMEWDEALTWIKEGYRNEVRDDAPEYWESAVYTWLSDHGRESGPDGMRDRDVQEALDALHLRPPPEPDVDPREVLRAIEETLWWAEGLYQGDDVGYRAGDFCFGGEFAEILRQHAKDIQTRLDWEDEDRDWRFSQMGGKV